MNLFTKLIKEKTSTLKKILKNPKASWQRKDTAKRILQEREVKKELGTKEFNKNKELIRQNIKADIQIERRQKKFDTSNIPSFDIKSILQKTRNNKIIERQLKRKQQWLKETSPTEINKAKEEIKKQVEEKYGAYYDLKASDLDKIAEDLYLSKRGDSEYLVIDIVSQYAREIPISESSESNFVKIE